MQINHASGDDVVAVQIGRQVDRNDETQPMAEPTTGTGTGTTNIRSGNATVGLQVDVIDLRF